MAARRQIDEVAGDDEQKLQKEQKRRRRLGRRASDEAIARGIAEHMPGATPEDIHGRLVGGLTLHQAVAECRKEALARNGKMGKSAWLHLRERHGLGTPGLVVRDKNEELAANMLLEGGFEDS
jgi:hypothetical protein